MLDMLFRQNKGGKDLNRTSIIKLNLLITRITSFTFENVSSINFVSHSPYSKNFVSFLKLNDENMSKIKFWTKSFYVKNKKTKEEI
jgi:hypothetical protein